MKRVDGIYEFMGTWRMYFYLSYTGALDAHLKKHSIEYMQFSFRWVNNLLTREFPLRCVIRLWDTYLVR